MEDHKTLITEIDTLTSEITEAINNPETISKCLLQIALKNDRLGNLYVMALDMERVAKTDYEYQLDESKLKIMATEVDDKGKRVSATYAESRSRIRKKDLLDELNTAKHTVDVLKVKRNDIDRIIDAARSRLSLIKNDIKRVE